MNPKELFNKAVEFYKADNLKEALNCCIQVTLMQPAFADAFNLSGLIARQQKDYVESVKQFRKALQIHEGNIIYLNNLGQSLFLLGKENDAVKALKKALAADPYFTPSLLQLGKYYRNKNEFDLAIANFEKILEKTPENISALNNLGNTYQLMKKSTKAMELYAKALVLNPEVPELHFNVGNIFLLNGQIAEAEKKFRKTIELNALFHQAYVPLSKILVQNKQPKKAKELLVQALKISPNDSETLFQLANNYRASGEIEESTLYYKRALKEDPKHVNALNNLGVTYFAIGMTEEARVCYEKAILLEPENADVLFAIAKLNENEKKYKEAINNFEKLLALKSSFHTQVVFDYFLLTMRIAKWDLYEEDTKLLKQYALDYINDSNQSFQLSPLTLNYFPLEQSIHKAVAIKYADILSSQVEGIKETCNFIYPTISKESKIRIGYISPDLRFHAVGMLLNKLFQQHDRSKFEIYAYSIVNNDDEYNKLFKAGADVFRDITRLSHEESAQLINKDQITILIDLAGYTTYTRTQILALKPAPIQMHFMGYPDTMGGAFMDYILADNYLIPEQDKEFYTEKVAHLEHAFFSSPFKTSEKKFTRTELGLPENAFVYCCFNSYHKIAPEVFSVWMEILKQTENSVLWLTNENELGANNMIKEAEKRGIKKERLIFANRLPMDEYLSAYTCADLFLDTFNYSAGSTAVCALWGELPVLTFAGQNNSSRMGASIVHAAQLDNFICTSKEDYQTTAIALASQKEKINAAKLHLKNNKLTTPLFDIRSAVKNMENTFLAILQNHGTHQGVSIK